MTDSHAPSTENCDQQVIALSAFLQGQSEVSAHLVAARSAMVRLTGQAVTMSVGTPRPVIESVPSPADRSYQIARRIGSGA